VICSEKFERGTLLRVAASFLGGVVPCRVSAISRNRQRPGYFELDLQFLTKPRSLPRTKSAAADADHPLLPRDVALAALELADRLERGEALRFSQVWRGIPRDRRRRFSEATALAVVLLLKDTLALDLARLLDTVRETGQKRPRRDPSEPPFGSRSGP
jgi:hypothetical protein